MISAFELEYIDSNRKQHRKQHQNYMIYSIHFNIHLLLLYVHVQPTFRPPSSFRPKTNWTGSIVCWSYRQNCCMANNMLGMRRHRWNRLIKVNALSACTTIPAAKCQAEPSKEDPISIQKITWLIRPRLSSEWVNQCGKYGWINEREEWYQPGWAPKYAILRQFMKMIE